MNPPAIQDKRQRVLIVIFDALRPEFVTPELMPNLHGFAQNGVRYANSHSIYPTETRVNQSAVITGCYPSRHGIVANKFVLNEGGPALVLNSGDDMQLESAFKQLDGRLLDVPTLGERLTAADLSYATLSAGTPGGGRLINHAAEINDSFRLAMKRPEAASPEGIMDAITGTIGPLPEYARPAIEWITYAVDCYLDHVEREVDPDVMLLWLCEPDETFHWHGIGSPEALRTMRHVDAEFGRILARQNDQIEAGELQVIALSDHGQISLEGARLDLAAKLTDAGFETGTDGASECTIALANAGGIWLRGSDPRRVADITSWLRQQDWCGPLFTRDGVAGTLTHEDVALAHRRAPDIALVLRHSNDANEWGIAGSTQHDAIYPVSGGCHGGLSRYELHNFLALSGSRFLQGKTMEIPAGNVDITPTVLDILGLDVPKDIDGRALREAYRNGSADAAMPEVQEQTLSSSNSEGPRTHLSVSRVGTTRYFNKAWVE